MKRERSLARIWVAVTGLVFLLPFGEAAPPSLDQAWELTSQMRLREAAAGFRPLAGTEAREAALGAAIVDLESSPSSPAKLADVRTRLGRLVAVNPDDEIGIRARYLIGRTRQLHEIAETPGDAAELVELVRDHPAHYLGQLALLKLAQHRLYSTSEARNPAERLAAAEGSLRRVTEPALLRDFHLVLGDAYLYFGDQRAAALPHYLAAEALGIDDPMVRATVLVQIGELARQEGQASVAIEAYEKFLKGFRRDIREYEVSRRLAALKGAR